MYGITTITTKGQVTIPEAVRSALGTRAGDKVIFEQIESKTKRGTYRIISSNNVVDELFGALKPYNKIGYISYKIARQKAGELLGQKYRVKRK